MAEGEGEACAKKDPRKVSQKDKKQMERWNQGCSCSGNPVAPDCAQNRGLGQRQEISSSATGETRMC